MKNVQDVKTTGKYLTEIKELPPEIEETDQEEQKPVEKESLQRKDMESKKDSALKELEHQEKNLSAVESDTDVKISERTFSVKDIILGLINLVSIGVLIFLLTKLPGKAGELVKLEKEKILNESNISYEFLDIKEAKSKSDELEALFLDEPGVVNFVNQVENLRISESAIQKVTFANQKAVKDKTGSFGIPIAIELKGSWDVIGQDLENIDKLPFLFRPVRVEVENSKLEGEDNVIIFKYGIFLYVNDQEFAK